jgi:hypothetical protein
VCGCTYAKCGGVCVWVYASVCVGVCVCVDVCVGACAYVRMCVGACAYVRMCVCMGVGVYVWVVGVGVMLWWYDLARHTEVPRPPPHRRQLWWPHRRPQPVHPYSASMPLDVCGAGYIHTCRRYVSTCSDTDVQRSIPTYICTYLFMTSRFVHVHTTPYIM